MSQSADLRFRNNMTRTQRTSSVRKLSQDKWVQVMRLKQLVADTAQQQHDAQRRTKQQQLYTTLSNQLAEAARAKQAEAHAARQAAVQAAADQAAYQQQQAAVAQRRRQAAEQLKAEREAQRAEATARARAAAEEARAQERAMNDQAALDLARELQAERAAVKAAKEELRGYLASYEAQRAAKAAQRAEQAALDLEYMQAQAALLDAMETQRAAKVVAMKRWQDNAQVRAAALPEYKRYIDPAIIEANYRKREEAHVVAEAAAAKEAADARRQLVEGLAVQLAEKSRLRELARAEQQEERRRIEDAVKAERAAAQRARAAKEAAKQELRASLEGQATRRRVHDMSEEEAKINKGLLAAVARHQQEGLLPTTKTLL